MDRISSWPDQSVEAGKKKKDDNATDLVNGLALDAFFSIGSRVDFHTSMTMKQLS